MRVEIKPCRPYGPVIAPPSKSMAHRMLICAGLADGESVVRGLAYSEDVKATIACLRSLGAEIRLDGDTAYIKGTDVTKPTDGTAMLPCNESGSTLRFFIPVCMLNGEERVLSGSRYLMTRPMSVYEDIAQKQNVSFMRSDESVTVRGRLQSGVYEVRGDISSQFISGLLFALPLLAGDSEIRILPPVESKPYIDMTVQALADFGIEIMNDGNIYKVKGGQSYRADNVTVEGDYSNAAFFEAMNYAGGDVAVTGLRDDSLQGDRIYKFLFEKIKNGSEPIDISDCPDLGPVLFAVAALCDGAVFTGTRRLRIKESDRASVMKEELIKLGISVDIGENDVVIHPGALKEPTEPLCGHNDHRIVMALSALLTETGGIIEGAEAVNKSFPDFFDKLKQLHTEVSL